MKQATLQIKFDEEKLNAIKQYMGKKDADFTADISHPVRTTNIFPVQSLPPFPASLKAPRTVLHGCFSSWRWRCP